MSQKIAPAREAAFEILMRVESGKGHSDELLRSPFVDSLSALDRNLCTALVMGVLRWQLALDAQVAQFLSRPNLRLDVEARIALRLGAFQLLHMDRIPAHAAISEGVELSKRAENRFVSGMVNAVLRKIAKLPSGDTTSRKDVKHLAIATAHPEWLVSRWASVYGFEATSSICSFDQEQPVAAIRLLHPSAEAKLIEEGIELELGNFLTAARRVRKGDVTATDTFREGLVRLQDEASQLIAELAGKGACILDTCAAPGGKTAVLAECNPEAEIVACDVSPRRLESMGEMLSSLPFASHVRCQVSDAALLKPESVYDLVLCDVPCSGTGTLARNPEIRHRLEAKDLARQQKRQKEILRASMGAVRPGGRLVYSTCSLEPEENEQVVESALDGQWKLLSAELQLDLLAESGRLTPEGLTHLKTKSLRREYLRTLPGVAPCDGFFAAILERL